MQLCKRHATQRECLLFTENFVLISFHVSNNPNHVGNVVELLLQINNNIALNHSLKHRDKSIYIYKDLID